MRYFLASLLLILFSCDNEEPAPERLVHECDPAKVLDKSRTWCCIGGPIHAIPGETLTYTYLTSISDPILHWKVEGDISILEGQGTGEARLKIGPDFTSGKIIVKGEGEMINGVYQRVCADVLELESWKGNN